MTSSLSTKFLEYVKPVQTFGIDRGYEFCYLLKFKHPRNGSTVQVFYDSALVISHLGHCHLALLSDEGSQHWYHVFMVAGYELVSMEFLPLIQESESCE